MADLDLDLFETATATVVALGAVVLALVARLSEAERRLRAKSADPSVVEVDRALWASTVEDLRLRTESLYRLAAEVGALRPLAERIEREHRPTWYAAHADREDEPGGDAEWVCNGCGEGVAAASPEPESGRDAIAHEDGCVWRMAREALDADGAPDV